MPKQTTDRFDINNIVDFKGLKIGLASPEVISNWSYGEVTKPETINYRTLKPEKDGLFSENIFGPSKDWECYCGKYKRIRYRGIICDKCGVEVTQSKVRRERMGHITLAAPAVHVWYFKGAPSKLSLLLNIPPRNLEGIIYFAQYLVTTIDEKKREAAQKELVRALGGKVDELKENADKLIKEASAEAKEKIAELKTKIKVKEQLEVALSEANLSLRQRTSLVRDELAVEESRAREIYKTIGDKVAGIKFLSILTEEEYLKIQEYVETDFFEASMGAECLLGVLRNLNLGQLASDLREELLKTTGQRHVKAAKRLRVVEGLKQSDQRPEWMILTILPVIPPDLRPMVQLTGGRFATSDLNDLYRRVINRNNRLRHLLDLGAPEIILRNEKRMLQEAVDALIDSAQRAGSRPIPASQSLKSLSDMLRGKQGRFRQNLLGKRVDYSGRSVIVVGPDLKLDQCGIPKEMALEMFKPFVLRELITRGLAPNVKNAKNVLEKRPPEVFDILEDITKNHPVLLNRAPTLHKLGIQAFYPVLIEGSAIQLHPCVTQGYNADFDGDQMAVHIPLSKASCEEAVRLMMPQNNLLKPADGSPVSVPIKEMILGCYYFTSVDGRKENPQNGQTSCFSAEEAILAYQLNKIGLREIIKARIDKKIFETTVGRILFNEILPEPLRYINEAVDKKGINKIIAQAISLGDLNMAVKLIDDLKHIGFVGSTISGISLAISDMHVSPDKEKIIAEGDAKVIEIEENYYRGLITKDESRRLSFDVWIETTDKVADSTWEQHGVENPVRMIMDSGSARASKDLIKSISGMRGLVVDPLGKIVPLPTKSNYRQGLSLFEYVTSARGARKGLTDLALKTADAGYLTRRLVDVSHDVLIREEDCQTKNGVEIGKLDRPKYFEQRILTRTALKKITNAKKVIVEAGELIDEEAAKEIVARGIESVWVRSPLTCEARYGLCAACYGRDFSSRKMVGIGVPVGVIAAQSIGEPGTQLTMRVKHLSGIIGLDVTQGLPRVEELFEARTPKTLSPIAEISGKLEVTETDDGYRLRIRTTTRPVEEREVFVPLTSTLIFEDGGLVSAGDQLASGFLDIRDVLEARGLLGAQRYLINEIQAVYESQGVPIHDKHFEVIVRKMSDKVRIENSGDTTILPGDIIDKVRFEEENAKVLAMGGEPATARVTILGLIRSALLTESWLSAASFQQTTDRLSDAAIMGKEDKLVGLKENVIIGRLIPVEADRARME